MKVGDYVRTKKGSIAKVLGIDYYIEGNGEELSNIESIFFDNVIDDIDKDIHSGVFQDCLKEYKSSPNIIDLIEAGDVLSYKDGSICRIMEITDKGYCLLKDYGGEQYYESKEWLKDIKSIVTSEQFSQMEYRIGE